MDADLSNYGQRPVEPWRDRTTPEPGHRRKCPTCKGTGINPELRMCVCPKCDGERRVAR